MPEIFTRSPGDSNSFNKLFKLTHRCWCHLLACEICRSDWCKSWETTNAILSQIFSTEEILQNCVYLRLPSQHGGASKQTFARYYIQRFINRNIKLDGIIVECVPAGSSPRACSERCYLLGEWESGSVQQRWATL